MRPIHQKPWKINTAPELAYLLAGQVSIYTKSHGKFIAIAGDSYKPPVNELHRTQAEPNGMTYVVVFGQNKNIAITKGRKKPSLDSTHLTAITQQAKKLAVLKNIKNIDNKLQTGHIPHSPYTIALWKHSMKPNITRQLPSNKLPGIIYILNGTMKVETEHHQTKKYGAGDNIKLNANTQYKITSGVQGIIYLEANIMLTEAHNQDVIWH